jgi:hypothetical protein
LLQQLETKKQAVSRSWCIAFLFENSLLYIPWLIPSQQQIRRHPNGLKTGNKVEFWLQEAASQREQCQHHQLS